MTKYKILTFLLIAFAMATTITTADAQDIFEEISGEPQVESTFISGRMTNKKKWKAHKGSPTIQLEGFTNMFTYDVTDKNTVAHARRLLDNYIKGNRDVELVMNKNNRLEKYEIYYKYGEDNRTIYQAVVWNQSSPDNVEIAVVNWKNGYGNPVKEESRFNRLDGISIPGNTKKGGKVQQNIFTETDSKGSQFIVISSDNNIAQGNDRKNGTKEFSLKKDITKLVNNTVFNVTYIQKEGSASIRLNISQNKMNDLVISQTDGILTLQHKSKNVSYDTKGCAIIVTAPDIDCFLNNATGDIIINSWRGGKFTYAGTGTGDLIMEELSGTSMSLNDSGTGDILIQKISGQEVQAYNGGTGDIKIHKATVGKADIINTGTGDLKFQSDDTVNGYLTNSGTGDVRLTGKFETLTVINSGSGDISLRGVKAKTLNKHNTGTGDITRTGDITGYSPARKGARSAGAGFAMNPGISLGILQPA